MSVTGDIQELVQMPSHELFERYVSGTPIQKMELTPGIYAGTSLGLPAFIVQLTWLKFFKIFEHDSDKWVGYNAKAEQNSIHEPWILKDNNPPEARYGFYEIVDRPFDASASKSLSATIDYGLAPKRQGVLSWIQDPLVRLQDNPDIILGRSYLVISGRWIPTPSYFSLHRFAGQ